MLKFSKIFFARKKKIVKENKESFEIVRNILFLNVESSKLSNYSTNMY
jgi:hypothetical protein